MSETVIAALVQAFGPTGLILAGLAWMFRHQQALINEVQEKRIQDAQTATTKLLELVQTQHKQMEQLSSAIHAQADAVHDLRGLVELLLSPKSTGTQPRGPLIPRGR